ncbi:GSCOCG00000595001-RA-CDS [Cotesia congregata]|nr:GSCOCG00000595001-RA-CDS [Cotesia congregata]
MLSKKYSRVLRVVADLVNQVSGFELPRANPMHGCEKRKFIGHVLGFKHPVNFFSSCWSLEFHPSQ